MNDEEKEIFIAMKEYIKTLYQAKAVNDTKMKFYYYLPIEELLEIWKIK